MNTIGLIFSFALPAAIVGFMAAACIWEARERRRAKRRDKRCHGIIRTWQDLRVGK